MSMPPHMVATTLALFDGDADEATVVARIVALRQNPNWKDAAGEPCVTNFRRVKLRVVTLATDPLTRRH